MCKTSQQLWLEYFRMELMYAHKLRTRRRIMGADDSAGDILLYLCIQDTCLLHGIAAPCLPVDADLSQICQASHVRAAQLPNARDVSQRIAKQQLVASLLRRTLYMQMCILLQV